MFKIFNGVLGFAQVCAGGSQIAEVRLLIESADLKDMARAKRVRILREIDGLEETLRQAEALEDERQSIRGRTRKLMDS